MIEDYDEQRLEKQPTFGVINYYIFEYTLTRNQIA